MGNKAAKASVQERLAQYFTEDEIPTVIEILRASESRKQAYELLLSAQFAVVPTIKTVGNYRAALLEEEGEGFSYQPAKGEELPEREPEEKAQRLTAEEIKANPELDAVATVLMEEHGLKGAQVLGGWLKSDGSLSARFAMDPLAELFQNQAELLRGVESALERDVPEHTFFSPQTTEDATGILHITDLQIGKADGTYGSGLTPMDTVPRSMAAITAALQFFAEMPRAPKHLAIAITGDCIEGFVSQGGRNAWGTPMELTAQIMAVQEVLVFAVKACVEYLMKTGGKLVVGVVGGNHDEAVRIPVTTTLTDSFDILAARNCELILKGREGFEDVEFVYPAIDSNTNTVPLPDGSAMFLTHGNHFRSGKGMEFWQSHSFDNPSIAAAGLMLTGHYHSFEIRTFSKKTWVQSGAMELESSWFKARTGCNGNPEMTCLIMAGNKMVLVRRVGE